MIQSLETILSYRNQPVFDRYEKSFPQNKLSAEAAFQELVKYLWLARKHSIEREDQPDNEALAFIAGMYPEMQAIDDMWHTFIIFTRDYQHFCKKYFGEFLHHAPETGDDKLDHQQFEIELTRYLTYVEQHLGESTLERWFAEHV